MGVSLANIFASQYIDLTSPWQTIQNHCTHNNLSLFLSICLASTSSFQVSPQPAMLNTKKLIDMARKSQKVSAVFRRTASGRSDNGSESDDICSTSSVASKGHIFVYTIERKRFMVPLEYLNHNIFRELFKITEEEFGLPSDGPVTLPCDATCMEYIISLLRYGVSRDVEWALLTSITSSCCFKDHFPQHGLVIQQQLVYGF